MTFQNRYATKEDAMNIVGDVIKYAGGEKITEFQVYVGNNGGSRIPNCIIYAGNNVVEIGKPRGILATALMETTRITPNAEGILENLERLL